MAMVSVRFFAGARDATGRGDDSFEAVTLGEVLDAARERYGEPFRAVLATSRVWVNGDEAAQRERTVLADADEIAILPPVSGG